MQIYLVVFDKDAFELSEKLFKSVSSYIDENYIRSTMLEEYGNDSLHDSSLKTDVYKRQALQLLNHLSTLRHK